LVYRYARLVSRTATCDIEGLHVHGAQALVPAHAARDHDDGHSHGLIDPSIVRSRAGVRFVLVSLAINS